MKKRENYFAQTPSERLVQWVMVAFIAIMVLFCAVLASAQERKAYDLYKNGRKQRQVNPSVREELRERRTFNIRFNKKLTGDFELVDPTTGTMEVVDGRGRKQRVKPARHFRSKKLGSISITESGVQGYLMDTLTGQAYTLSDTGATAVKAQVFEQYEPPVAPGIEVPENMPQANLPGFEADAALVMSTKVARIYYVVDYQLFQKCGSIQAAVDFTTALHAAVVAFYNPIGIDHKIARIKVYDTPDPWQTVGGISQLLLFFSTDMGSETGVDLKHLLFYRNASWGGLAYVAGINHAQANCGVSGVTPYLTKTVPGGGSGEYNWPIGCVSHEMGHNYGSKHTHWCGWNLTNGTRGRLDSCYTGETYNGVACGSTIKLPKGGGTLMSYCHITLAGINFSKGFHPACADVMRQTLAANTTIPQVKPPTLPPSPCLFTYPAEWEPCRPNNTQRRALLGASPSGCVGVPDTVRSCVYIPPTPISQDGIPGAVTMRTVNGQSWFSFPLATDATDWQYEVNYCSYDGKTPPDSVSKPKACSIRNRLNFTKPTSAQLSAGKIDLLANPQPMTKGLWYKVQVRYRRGSTGAIQTKNSAWSVW